MVVVVVKLTTPTVSELVLLCKPSRCSKAVALDLVVKVVKVEVQEVRLR